jgi:AraC-like DNA-binding protein
MHSILDNEKIPGAQTFIFMEAGVCSVSDQRIAKAQFLLRNPGLEIKEVCFLTGYRHMTAFYRDFKNIAGETPGQFRKSQNRSF